MVQFINPPIEAFTGAPFRPNPLAASFGAGFRGFQAQQKEQQEEQRELEALGDLVRSINPQINSLDPEVQERVIKSAQILGPRGIGAILRSGSFKDLADSIPEETPVQDFILSSLGGLATGARDLAQEAGGGLIDFFSGGDGGLQPPGVIAPGEPPLDDIQPSGFLDTPRGVTPGVGPVLDPGLIQSLLQPGQAKQPKGTETLNKRSAVLFKKINDAARNDPRLRGEDLKLSTIKKEAKAAGISVNEMLVQIAEKLGI